MMRPAMYVSRTRSRLGGYDTSFSMPHNIDLQRGCSDMSKSVRGRDSARSLACADGASVEVTRPSLTPGRWFEVERRRRTGRSRQRRKAGSTALPIRVHLMLARLQSRGGWSRLLANIPDRTVRRPMQMEDQ